jgi:geranylgeranylglycerol-phosphate geranylgeranyltransferase
LTSMLAPAVGLVERTRSLRALAQVVRPVNAALMAVGVGVGGMLGGGGAALAHAGGPLLLAAASATALGAAANAHNDVCDLEIDRVNRPDRPLPSGALSVPAARTVWAALTTLGVGLAALLSPLHLAVAAVSAVLLAAYNADLKRRPLVGNLAVSVVIGLALPFGGAAVWATGTGKMAPVALGAAFAFGSTLAREVAKDIEDTEGDSTGGAVTLPVRFGVPVAAWLSAGAALGTVAALPLGLWAGLHPAFLLLALPTAALLLAAAWAVLGARGEAAAAQAGRASALLKGAMLAGLLALAVAAW